MKPLRMLWRNMALQPASLFSGGLWQGALPLANLLDKDIRKVARSGNTQETSTQFLLDAGADATFPDALARWDTFALMNHSISASGFVRIVVSNSPTEGQGVVYDSGYVAAWMGQDQFNPVSLPGGMLYLLCLDTAVAGRYVRVYIRDGGNTAGFVDIGRFVAGQGWSPAVNYSYNASIQWKDDSQPRRSRAGRRRVDDLPRYRVLNLSLSALTEAEAYLSAYELDKQLGKAGEVLVIPDRSKSSEYLLRQTVFVNPTDTAPIVHAYYKQWTWTFSGEEIL